MKNIVSKIRSFLDNFGSSIINAGKNILGFIVNTAGELKNVTWLKRQDTLKFTSYVLVFIAVTAGFIALMDLIFFRLLALATTN